MRVFEEGVRLCVVREQEERENFLCGWFSYQTNFQSPSLSLPLSIQTEMQQQQQKRENEAQRRHATVYHHKIFIFSWNQNFWNFLRTFETMSSKTTVSNEEELYDRQIRLWGLEAQSRMWCQSVDCGIERTHGGTSSLTFTSPILKTTPKKHRYAKILCWVESVWPYKIYQCDERWSLWCSIFVGKDDVGIRAEAG